MPLRQGSAREALERALNRRGSSPIGTPLQQIYAQRYPEPTEVEATTFWGQPITVMLPELVSSEIDAYGLIEPALSALIIEVARPGVIMFDVGAHLGYHSMLAASLGAEVHAFEPSEKTIPVLRANAGEAVSIVPRALWERETVLELKDFGDAHSAVNTLLASKDEGLAEPIRAYQVSVTTVDRYVESSQETPNFIKIDAEGAELQVLRGATATLRQARPLVTIEVGDTSHQATSRPAIEFARDSGYEPYELTEHGLKRHNLRDRYPYGNLLLLPAGADPPMPIEG